MADARHPSSKVAMTSACPPCVPRNVIFCWKGFVSSERWSNKYIGEELNSASLCKTLSTFSSTLSLSPSVEPSHSGTSTPSDWVLLLRTDWFPSKPPVLRHFPGRFQSSSRCSIDSRCSGDSPAGSMHSRSGCSNMARCTASELEFVGDP